MRSHRDLPIRLYLSTAKFRDELSPRGGLMRGREFVMGDAYTFDTGAAGMRASVGFLNDACRAALLGMGLTGVFQATADGGSIAAGPSTEHPGASRSWRCRTGGRWRPRPYAVPGLAAAAAGGQQRPLGLVDVPAAPREPWSRPGG
ncbi:aminoacyl--tRNA ligase-related protein [Streptomyces mirabilis]|uniref:aminoacyl--tRNA ligase-related protein n=1 Tax=Streptomyces mirabilis TaxID=68239 RepID=UPI003695FC84